MENEFQNGLAPDPRTEEQKAQDYRHSDIYGTSVVWQKGKTLKAYTKRNQNGSLSCCGQGSSKGVETLVAKNLEKFWLFSRLDTFCKARQLVSNS